MGNLSVLHRAVPAASAPPRQLGVVLHGSVEAAEPSWRALQAEGVLTAYQRWEWAAAIARHLLGAAGAAAVIVELRDAESGDLLLLLPLQRRRRSGLRVLEPFGAGVTDYAAPLLSARLVDALALDPALPARLWGAITAALPRVDLLELGQIPPMLALGQGSVTNPLADVAGLHDSPVTASGVAIGGEAETLLRRLCSSQTVRAIASGRRKLEKMGEYRYVVARDEATRTTMLDALMAQRRERFSELGRFDLIRRGQVERFYREAAGSGLVQLSGVSVGGEWIAMAYGLVHDRAFHGIILSIGGAKWRPFSPGMVLIAELLQASCRDGLRYFDFTVGAMAYKARFGAETVTLRELVVPLTVRGRVWTRGARWAGAMQRRIAANEALYARLRKARQALRRVAR